MLRFSLVVDLSNHRAVARPCNDDESQHVISSRSPTFLFLICCKNPEALVSIQLNLGTTHIVVYDCRVSVYWVHESVDNWTNLYRESLG